MAMDFTLGGVVGANATDSELATIGQTCGASYYSALFQRGVLSAQAQDKLSSQKGSGCPLDNNCVSFIPPSNAYDSIGLPDLAPGGP